MRVGKKANVVEAKKTRSCVVRLEKVSSPPIKVTRSSGITSRGIQLHTEEKKLKGPIKKRPIAQGSNTTVSPSADTQISATSTKSKVKEMKEKFKTPIRGQKAEVVKPEAVDPPTPTIASGRSRRAIKPNPKYASDDMVTPKIIRNVSAIAGSSSTTKRPTLVPEKQRRRSTSSSDDFFNKDSSDELGANDFDDEVDKMYRELEKESDSDFSEEPKISDSSSKKRGRPKKAMQTIPSSTSASTPRPAPTPQHKGQTSQLQLLRKSFAASVNRSIEPSSGIKRKRIDSIGSSSENDNDSACVIRKRILLTKSVMPRENKISNSTNISMLVRKPNTALNGSRILKIKPESMETDKSKRGPTIIEKRTLMDGNSVPIRINQQSKQLHAIRTVSNNTATSATATRTLITTSSKTQNARVLAEAKRRSASPAVPKVTKPAEDKVEDRKLNIIQETSPSNNDEHDDLMPTFTIVNINDIINKKGDVLISKTGRPHNDSVKTDHAHGPEPAKISEQKPGPMRRKGYLAEKVGEISRSKSPMTTIKKPTQRILNHTLIKKSSSDASTVRNKVNSNPEKPAPRILNSMVAKKTQPVKPMIANFDDSADDEIYPISFDDDEDVDEDDGNDTNDTGDLDEDIDEAEGSFQVGKNRPPTSTPYQPKKTAPSSSFKENSQAAINRPQPAKNVIQRKVSPEKVVISRQGDKIVKKITCFETWYVIIPEEMKPKVSQNILDIPLIKLANVATEISLPTNDWKSKVTLHELSPSMIAKSNLITYTGNLKDYNIPEKDRGRYQPSCVMFRRSVNDRTKSRLPYDRAVIFKNKTFFTNIEGKNVKLVGAPSTISTQKDVEILLQIVDSLTLQSSLVEPTNTIQ